MSTVVKAKTFINQFVALIKGDDAEVLAQKVQRKAESALETRLASLKGTVVDMEDKVTDAEENLQNARVNYGKEITDRDYYIDNLINANLRLEEAKTNLENLKYTIEYLNGELKQVRS
jgi:DNA repair exonuclease SbcCD ATPase subunit